MRNKSKRLFKFVPENKDFLEDAHEYSKYDPEESADQLLINSGATSMYVTVGLWRLLRM